MHLSIHTVCPMPGCPFVLPARIASRPLQVATGVHLWVLVCVYHAAATPPHWTSSVAPNRLKPTLFGLFCEAPTSLDREASAQMLTSTWRLIPPSFKVSPWRSEQRVGGSGSRGHPEDGDNREVGCAVVILTKLTVLLRFVNCGNTPRWHLTASERCYH